MKAAVILVASTLVMAACAGTEATPEPDFPTVPPTGRGPGGTSPDTAPGTTGSPATTAAPSGTEPPETTTTVRPGAAIEDLGPLSEANPRVAGNPARDVGISVRLSDGRYLWIFGDTLFNGQVLSNTAGISAAGSFAIHDHADGNGRLSQFIPFTAEEEAYNRAHFGEGSRWILWPNAAVAVDGGRRVLVFFERSITNLRPGGLSSTGATSKPTIGVAEWNVADANGGPIRARRVNDSTFTGANLFAAYLDATGNAMWLISCGDRNVCRAAKVAVDKATDGTAWTWWTGGGFSADWRSGARLSFPDPESAFFGLKYPDGAPFVASPFAGGNVVWDPSRQLYIFGFTAWPGYSNVGYLRASRGPAGPWGPPLRFVLPGCDGGDCYALSVHPELSRGPNALGVSYHLPPFNRAATVDISRLTPG